jgi:hypothetical protein
MSVIKENTSQKMQAITISEPFATCVLSHDRRVDNRSFPFPRHLLNKSIALVTSASPDLSTDLKNLEEVHGIELERTFPADFAIALIRITECSTVVTSQWGRQGLYQWHIEVDSLITRPVRVPNPKRNGIWELDQGSARETKRQLGKLTLTAQ